MASDTALTAVHSHNTIFQVASVVGVVATGITADREVFCTISAAP